MKYLLPLLVFSTIFLNCQDSKQTNKNQQQKKDSLELAQRFNKAKPADSSKKLAESSNRFGMDCYNELRQTKENEGKNIVFSPISLHLALGMTYFGSTGETAQELEKVLYLPKKADLSQDFYDMQGALLRNDSVYQISIANSIWVTQGTSLNPDYQSLLKKFFETEAYQDDFKNPKTADKINAWVSKQTHKKIPSIINADVLAELDMILLNAVYFKGAWDEPFDEEQSKEEDFYLLNGTKIKTQMMKKDEEVKAAFYEDSQLKMLKLPYKEGKYAMYFILPKNHNALPSLENDLNYTQIQNLISKLKYETLIKCYIPKFILEAEAAYPDILKKLGIKTLFEEGKSRLNKMANNTNLFVSNIRQKNFIEVNEKGAEAAAVTIEEMPKEEAMPEEKPKPKEFVADRPFLFFIQEEESKSILFFGRILNPKETKKMADID